MTVSDLKTQIEALKPWRYNHYADNALIIEADAQNAAKDFDALYRGLMEHIIQTICQQGDPSQMRVLDMGCLEGHYTDLFCAAGFQEVVGIDLSQGHIDRAEFLLKQVRGYTNVRLIHGDVMDGALLRSLGKFDVILFHGLLYHLTDPILAFELFEQMMPDNRQFYLLLSTQYKFDRETLMSPLPLANVNLRKLGEKMQLKEGQEVSSISDGSSFRRYAMRLNPAAVYKILQYYGYQNLIHYDTHEGYTYSYHNSLIATRETAPNLLSRLQAHSFEGVTFSNWNGRSVNGLVFPEKTAPKSNPFLKRARDSFRYRSGLLIKKMGLR